MDIFDIISKSNNRLLKVEGENAEIIKKISNAHELETFLSIAIVQFTYINGAIAKNITCTSNRVLVDRYESLVKPNKKSRVGLEDDFTHSNDKNTILTYNFDEMRIRPYAVEKIALRHFVILDVKNIALLTELINDFLRQSNTK